MEKGRRGLDRCVIIGYEQRTYTDGRRAMMDVVDRLSRAGMPLRLPLYREPRVDDLSATI